MYVCRSFQGINIILRVIDSSVRIRCPPVLNAVTGVYFYGHHYIAPNCMVISTFIPSNTVGLTQGMINLVIYNFIKTMYLT